MRNIWAILLFLLGSTAYAAIPWEVPNNDMKFGDGAATAKSLELKMGLGASNPVFSSAAGTEIQINIPFRVDANALTVGDGTAQDLKIDFDTNGTADVPSIKYDSVKDALVFKSKAGDTFKKIGAGGAGGGESYNNAFVFDDKNPDGEDGTTGWTASAGTFVMETTDPLEGEQSFKWTPSLQNDTLDSSVLTFDRDIFKGRACEVSIEYIGGDLNLDLLVVDGNGAILNPLKGDPSKEGNNRSLPPHTISAKETFSFICPSAADIAGDAQKGNLKLQLKNVGATASALIKFDKSYLGTLQILSETTTPDSFGGWFSGADGSLVEGDNFTTCVRNSLGNYTCNYTSLGLTSIPAVSVIAGAVGGTIGSTTAILSLTATAVNFNIIRTDSHGLFDVLFSLKLKKTGADAKQKVQVIKLLPKVSEHTNVFSAKVSATGVVTEDDFDIIDGDCTFSSAGVVGCTFNPNIFTVAPKITGCTTIHSGTTSGVCEDNGTSPTGFNLLTEGNDTRVSLPFTIEITKAGVDYKTAGVQNISLGGLTINSYAESSQKNVRVESCFVTNAGTPAAGSTMCDAWIDSFTDSGVGLIDLNLKAGIFSEAPHCSGASYGNYLLALTGSVSTSAVQTTVTLGSTGAATDRNFWIHCIGKR